MTSPDPRGQESNGHEDVLYNVQTSWEDLHKPTFAAASSFTYFVEMLATHPLDVIRASIQTSQTTSSLEIVKQRIKRSGLKSFYQGFWPATFGHLPGTAIYLVTYTYLKDALQKLENRRHPEGSRADGRQAPWVSFAAAAGADAAAICFYAPVDVIVQRLFLQNSKSVQYKSAADVVQSMYKKEGLKGFYRGMSTVLVNSVPGSALWWTFYEWSKTKMAEWIERYKQNEEAKQMENRKNKFKKILVVNKHIAANMAAGAFAGAVVTFITNPLDVVRTRLQTQTMKVENYEYSNARNTISSMWKQEGIRAFYKGLTPRMVEWIIFSSFSAFAYEMVVDMSTIRKNPKGEGELLSPSQLYEHKSHQLYEKKGHQL